MTNRFTLHRNAPGALAGALTAIVVAAAPLTPASAQTDPTTSATAQIDPTASATTLPGEVQAGAVRYMSGGVSQDQADLFKDRARDYPLAIEIVEKAEEAGVRDQYTANARVVIRRQGGAEVLDARAEGPFMLVRLDPGTYDIAATLGERTLYKQRVVVYDGRSTHTVFVFPAGTN